MPERLTEYIRRIEQNLLPETSDILSAKRIQIRDLQSCFHWSRPIIVTSCMKVVTGQFHGLHSLCSAFFPDIMMSKTKNNELKFSIQNLIDTTSCEQNEKELSTDIHHSQTTNRSLKRLVVEPQRPLVRRPVPHPCWSFLSQLTNKNPIGTLPLNSPLILLNKMNQFWQQLHRTQISPSTENYDVSDEDTDTSSIHDDIEIEDDDDEEEDDEGSVVDKLKYSLNSEDTDKLKTYPCKQCGKVRFTIRYTKSIVL